MVREAVYQLERAQDRLGSARNWGIFDILGGGLISTLVKHDRMDSAGDCIREASRLMERVRQMLPDIQVGGIPTEGDGFGRVADLLFDGFFTDMYMQGRINDRREAVDRMLSRVRRLERELTRLSA